MDPALKTVDVSNNEEVVPPTEDAPTSGAQPAVEMPGNEQNDREMSEAPSPEPVALSDAQYKLLKAMKKGDELLFDGFAPTLKGIRVDTDLMRQLLHSKVIEVVSKDEDGTSTYAITELGEASRLAIATKNAEVFKKKA